MSSTLSVQQRNKARVNPRVTWRQVILTCLISAVGLALLMNGSVADPYRQIAFLVLTLPLLAALGTRLSHQPVRNLLRWTVGICVVLGCGALAQGIALPENLFAHPVWSQLPELGIAAPQTISVAPAQTLGALPALVMPMLVFAAMLLLCQERREAVFAWKALAALGLGLAALSAVLEIGFPEATFFSRFEVGRGAFNGIFVNRNVTAAFLGLTAIAVAGWLLLPGRTRDPRLPEGGAPVDWRRVFLAAALFLVLIALITTRSRAGATLALICLTISLAAVFALRHVSDDRPVQRLGPAAKAALALLGGVALFFGFGEPVMSRLALDADDGRLCVHAATLQMIAERPLFGSGFGTFADAFPQYRDPECLGTSGAWMRAHNSHLEFLAGMGLIGGAVALVALMVLVRTLLAGVRMRKSLQAIPILCLGALAFVLMHSALDFPLQIPGVALYFAALMGAGCAISSLSRTSRGRSRGSARDH